MYLNGTLIKQNKVSKPFKNIKEKAVTVVEVYVEIVIRFVVEEMIECGYQVRI